MARKKNEAPKKYKFRDGYRAKVDAGDAGEELERIRAERGELTTRAVIDEARPEDAVLHPAFTWDDAVAAEKFREVEARNLIRSVEVVYPEADKKAPTAVYVHVPAAKGSDTREGDYKPIADVLTNEDFYTRAFEHLSAKMAAAASAVNELERAARTVGEPERLAVVSMVVRAVETARDAVKQLAHAS